MVPLATTSWDAQPTAKDIPLARAIKRFGLATDPVSQPLEVPGTGPRMRAMCLGEQSEPQMLIRPGWPSAGAARLPATGRRSVGDTIADWEP